MAKKVGTTPKTETETTDDKPKGRQAFDYSKAQLMVDGKLVTAVNADGKLVNPVVEVKDGDTVVQAGYNHRIHKPLTKADFADEVGYLRHTAVVARQKGAIMIALADERDARAAQLAKFGDKKTRAKVKKLQRMQEAQAALLATLAESGVDIAELTTKPAEKPAA